jgi:hypothetical protein
MERSTIGTQPKKWNQEQMVLRAAPMGVILFEFSSMA